jgi:hypothetical protein
VAKKKRKVKLPKSRQEALWAASLERRGDIQQLIERCIASGGECKSIAICVGDACKLISRQPTALPLAQTPVVLAGDRDALPESMPDTP